MPHLQTLHEKYPADEVEILIIDVRNLKDRTQAIADDALLSVPVLLDDQEISRGKYGVFATPTTFIVDHSGKAIFKHIGYEEGDEDMLEREVELLLERERTDTGA